MWGCGYARTDYFDEMPAFRDTLLLFDWTALGNNPLDIVMSLGDDDDVKPRESDGEYVASSAIFPESFDVAEPEAEKSELVSLSENQPLSGSFSNSSFTSNKSTPRVFL
mmetsp:Transcript_16013/g.28745  ORF Transcript_16013/g.28745 Transcript_16013/m.28745 type:complete len:109 (-) Transcript_16013:472-798(-)